MKYKITIEFEDFSARVIDVIHRLVSGFPDLHLHDVLDRIKNNDKEISGHSTNTSWKLERLDP